MNVAFILVRFSDIIGSVIRRAHLRVELLVLASACGPSATEEAELRELCGHVGPVRVLEFPEDARPYAYAQLLRLDDDRLLWQLGSAAPDAEGYPWPSRFWGAWITGRCGESPVELPSVASAHLDPHVPGVLLAPMGTAEQYDLAVIDPDAPAEQRTLFTGIGVALGSAKSGLVSVDEKDVEVGSVSFRAYPEDPFSGVVAPTTLAQIDLPSTTWVSEKTDALARVVVHEDAAWVLTSDDELLRIALPSGASSVEQVGVRTFTISDDERWLVWEDLSVVEYGAVFGEPIGRSQLRDRNDDVDRPLWIGHAYPWSPVSIEDGVIRGPGGWLRVDDLSPVVLPEGRDLIGPFGDERRWLTVHRASAPEGGDSEPLGYGLFDIDTGVETPLFDRPAQMIAVRDDGIELLHGVYFGTPPSAEEVPLVFAPFDGSPPRELARSVTTAYRRMADGRIVTPVDLAPDFRSATLVLVDPETLETSRIDDHAFVHQPLPEPDPGIWGDDVVLYSVADGDRSGMWIARLPL